MSPAFYRMLGLVGMPLTTAWALLLFARNAVVGSGRAPMVRGRAIGGRVALRDLSGGIFGFRVELDVGHAIVEAVTVPLPLGRRELALRFRQAGVDKGRLFIPYEPRSGDSDALLEFLGRHGIDVAFVDEAAAFEKPPDR